MPSVQIKSKLCQLLILATNIVWHPRFGRRTKWNCNCIFQRACPDPIHFQITYFGMTHHRLLPHCIIERTLKPVFKEFLWLFFMGCYSPALTGNNYISEFTIIRQQFWCFLVRSLSIAPCLQSLPSLAICSPCKVQHYSIKPSLLFWKSVYILCTRTGRKWNCTGAWLCLRSCFHVTIWSS